MNRMNNWVKIDPVENEDFSKMLEYINRVIGIDEELPDKIIFEWKDGSKMIFVWNDKDSTWYYNIIEEDQ